MALNSGARRRLARLLTGWYALGYERAPKHLASLTIEQCYEQIDHLEGRLQAAQEAKRRG